MKKISLALAGLLVATLSACGGSSAAKTVGVDEFATQVATAGVVTLDVRTPAEFMEGHIDGAINIDFESGNFENEIAALDPNATYAVYCRSGNRSGQAVKVMSGAGFSNLYNLDGGVIDWAGAGQQLVQ
jgi:rhodanese-related sulfurtransferase